MRVITGSARGKRLKEPRNQDTRPTTDRVKEGLFNIVQFDLEGRRVLDLFAGTGQLGIEALSRGAAHVTFVDLRRESAALVQENLALTGLADRANVVQGDSLAFLAACGEKFDMVFIDPPYNTPLLEQALELAAKIDILREHGIMICESAAERQLPPLNAPYCRGKEYRYGQIKLTAYRRQGREPRDENCNLSR